MNMHANTAIPPDPFGDEVNTRMGSGWRYEAIKSKVRNEPEDKRRRMLCDAMDALDGIDVIVALLGASELERVSRDDGSPILQQRATGALFNTVRLLHGMADHFLQEEFHTLTKEPRS